MEQLGSGTEPIPSKQVRKGLSAAENRPPRVLRALDKDFPSEEALLRRPSLGSAEVPSAEVLRAYDMESSAPEEEAPKS